jgi:hypothetical protein
MEIQMKNVPYIGIVMLFAILSGCASLNGGVPFRYVPSLPTIEQSSYRIGLEKLTDGRPQEDRDSTESIPAVDEKMTSKLLEDMRSSQMFRGVDLPASKTKDAFIMKGEIM